MNAKRLKFYRLFNAFSRMDISKASVIEKYVKEFLALDYECAEEIWEYLLIESEALLSDPNAADVFIDIPLKLFYAAAPVKTVKTLLETPVIANAVFRFSPKCDCNDAFTVIENLILGGKTESANVFLALVMRNTAMKSTFGGFMKKLMEKLFVEFMKKATDKRNFLPRKAAALLDDYIKKVKTDEKPLLQQRLKEVM